MRDGCVVQRVTTRTPDSWLLQSLSSCAVSDRGAAPTLTETNSCGVAWHVGRGRV
jgi:hypothetical protein